MIQMYFGKACKEYREEMNISQEKFALSIGMDRTYYSSVEAGKRNVSIQNIKKIADGYTVAIVIVSRFGMRYILRVYFRQRISMLELLVEKTREKTLLNSFLDELQNMYIIIRSGMSIKLMSLQEISILILMI